MLLHVHQHIMSGLHNPEPRGYSGVRASPSHTRRGLCSCYTITFQQLLRDVSNRTLGLAAGVGIGVGIARCLPRRIAVGLGIEGGPQIPGGGERSRLAKRASRRATRDARPCFCCCRLCLAKRAAWRAARFARRTCCWLQVLASVLALVLASDLASVMASSFSSSSSSLEMLM